MNSNTIKDEFRRFEFNKTFLKEFEHMISIYDKTYSELSKVVSKSTVDIEAEYGVCNNNYKLRYITPNNISSYISYLMKALQKNLITDNINDLEKFSVQMVKGFMAENECIPIENSAIYGLSKYTSDTMTLREMIVLCENDIYHTSVCSKYDITQRRAAMKSDWNKFSGIHYGANIKKIVTSIPQLMSSTSYADMDMVTREAIRDYIQEFILFATMMNIITMSNMILYCVPKSTFNTALVDKKPEKIENNTLNNEGDDLFEGTFEEYANQTELETEQAYLESVDMTQSKPIFVVCCEFNPNDWTSRNISKVTKSKYSHIVFSMDPTLKKCYEYHDKIEETIYGNKSGFHEVSLLSDTYEDRRMAVYATFVSNEDFDKIKETINDFGAHKTKYDKLILATKLFKIDKKITKSQYKQVCSTFVDRLFKTIEINLTGKRVPSPAEMQKTVSIMPENFIKLYDGPCPEYEFADLSDKLKGFAARDYVHEIKKNESYEAYTESVNTRVSKPIFVTLVEKNTGELVSETICKITNSIHTHAVFSMDIGLDETYGFDMHFDEDKESGNKSGFHKVDIKGPGYSHRKMATYATYVPKEAYDKLKEVIEEFKTNKDSRKYDMSLIVSGIFKIDKKPSKNKYKQVCSTFVDALFKTIGVDLTGKNTPNPADIKKAIDNRFDEFVLLYDGPCSEYDTKHAQQILKKFAKRTDSKVLNECYVEHADLITECCLLKTNNLVIHNKIPFNINMRNIVLEDMHPQFKDTLSAIHFITTDSRSPISQLLIKYSSDNKSNIYVDPMVIINLFGHNRCPMESMKDPYAKHHDMDFHTDVNWLDKIAYGNNYLNGNYRTDGVGNHHMDPIKNSLDNLYRMFGDCALVESKDLADHIIKVSKLMESVIHAYRDLRIENWEMVRDILAVLGEIMTRSMIKLYNNHMTVFVARDNMDDVDTPAYLYSEAFVLEADATPRVEVDPKDNTGMIKNAVRTVRDTMSHIYHQFLTWIHQNFMNGPLKFNKDHEKEVAYVNSEQTQALHKEIAAAIQNHKFSPKVTNFPDFKIPQKKIAEGNQNLTSIVDQLLTKTDVGDPLDQIREHYYPTELRTALKNLTGKQAQEAVSNFFLYGNTIHQNTGNAVTYITAEQWNSLRDDVLLTGKILETDVKKIADDLTAATKKVEAVYKDNKTKLDAAKKASEDTNGNATSNNGDVATLQKKVDACDNIIRALQQVSSEYGCTFLNVISSKFYGTTYTLYRDIITTYNQQKNSYQTNNQTTQNQNQNTPANPTNPTNPTNSTNPTNPTTPPAPPASNT